MIVRPRSVGSLRTSRPSSACLSRSAVSSRAVAAAASRSAAESSRTRCRRRRRGRPRGGGGPVLPPVGAADRQLAVAAVDQHGQLHGAGPAVVGQRVQGCAHGAAGHQDVVDEDHEPVVEPAVGYGGVLKRAGGAAAQVVAIEGGVDRPDLRSGAGELADRGGQAAGQHGAARGDADEHRCREGLPSVARGLLDDLVRDARDGAGDVGGAEQLPVARHARDVPAAVVRHEGTPSPPHRTGLKGTWCDDRISGCGRVPPRGQRTS